MQIRIQDSRRIVKNLQRSQFTHFRNGLMNFIENSCKHQALQGLCTGLRNLLYLPLIEKRFSGQTNFRAGISIISTTMTKFLD